MNAKQLIPPKVGLKSVINQLNQLVSAFYSYLITHTKRVCLESPPIKWRRMLYKRWKPFGGDKTKAETERTGNGIIIINKGIGLPQTTFIDCPVFTGSSLQTTLCCVGRKLPRW